VPSDFRVGPWLVQPGLNTVSHNGTSLPLEPKVMEVLVRLAHHPGEPVSKEQLLQTVWPDTFVSDGVLVRSISELRRVFKDDAREPRFIQTIPKRGYRLVAPVKTVNGDSAGVSSRTKLVSPAVSRGALGMGFWVGAGAAALFLAVLGLMPTRVWQEFMSGHKVPRIQSIAVLPLKNLSADPSQKYFASGMTEELITDLSQISALKVISRTSSEVYENTQKTLPEIARELNVDAVIEGSVVRSGNRVRVTAQLIYAPEDKNLWARSYDRDLEDALALQGAIANAIADEVRTQVQPGERMRLNRARAVSPRVLDAYLQGNYHLHRVGRGVVDEEMRKAEQDFQRAIDGDPAFAPAYIGLGYAHAPILGGTGLMNPSPRDYEVRKWAAEKALELDPDSSEAHGLQASVYCEDWKWSAAEEELRRAIALDPNRADAHDDYSTFLFATGRQNEGMKESEIAQELDPKMDRMYGAFANSGRYDEAISLMLRDLERDPDDGQRHFDLYQVYALSRRYPEAIQELEEAGKLFGFVDFEGPLDHAFKTAGFQAAIRTVARDLENLQRAGKIYMPGVLAEYYSTAGEQDRAIYWLEDAYRNKHRSGADGGLLWLKGNPMYAPLHSDPRYKDLVRRLGLAE